MGNYLSLCNLSEFQRVKTCYFNLKHTFSFKDINIPTPLNQIFRFKINNNVYNDNFAIDEKTKFI